MSFTFSSDVLLIGIFPPFLPSGIEIRVRILKPGDEVGSVLRYLRKRRRYEDERRGDRYPRLGVVYYQGAVGLRTARTLSAFTGLGVYVTSDRF